MHSFILSTYVQVRIRSSPSPRIDSVTWNVWNISEISYSDGNLLKLNWKNVVFCWQKRSKKLRSMFLRIQIAQWHVDFRGLTPSKPNLIKTETQGVSVHQQDDMKSHYKCISTLDSNFAFSRLTVEHRPNIESHWWNDVRINQANVMEHHSQNDE